MQMTPAKPFTMRHSGKEFKSEHRGPHGCYIWPNEEFFVRRPVKPEVRARIERLSGGVQEEGELPRGYHPKRRGKRWLKKDGRIGDAMRMFGVGSV